MTTPAEVKSVEDLKRVLGTIQDAQASLKERGESLQTNMEGKVNDLMAAVRSLEEAQTAARAPAAVVGDASLRIYTVDGQTRSGATAISENRARFTVDDESGRGVQLRHTIDRDEGVTWGLLDDPEPASEWQAELQKVCADRALVRTCMKDGRSTPASDRRIRRVLANAPDEVRRAFNDNAGVGAEWIPDVTLAQLESGLEIPRVIEGMFARTTVPAGGSIVSPFLTKGVRPYLISGSIVTGDSPSDLTASTPTTADRTRTAVALAGHCVIDPFAAEDSIIAALPTLRKLFAEADRDATEDAIINGDTAGTHQDTLVSWNIRSRWDGTLGTAADHRKAWLGLRARSFDSSTTVDLGSAQTAKGVLSVAAAMNAENFAGGDVACIISPEFLLAGLLDDDNLLTVDKIGQLATLLTGQVASLYGMPVVLSRFMGADLNASGIYDNTTTTKTGVIVVDRSRYWTGYRMAGMMETQKEIKTQAIHVTNVSRKIFTTWDADTTDNVGYGYNLANS